MGGLKLQLLSIILQWRKYHGTGITPDITVEIPQEILEKDYDRNIDPQFKKALEVIRDKN